MTYRTPLAGALIGFMFGPLLGLLLNRMGGESFIGEIGFFYNILLFAIFRNISELIGFIPQNDGFTAGIIFFVSLGTAIATLGHYWIQLGYRWNFGIGGLGKT